MDFASFLTQVIDGGIAEARVAYANRPDKLTGSINGFEACRGKTREELRAVLDNAVLEREKASMGRAKNYWEIRCYEAQVEWVCNVVSAAASNQKDWIIQPSTRGLMRAAAILGTEPLDSRTLH